ncbi:protein sorting-associated protein 54 [Seminavis robusta]|uniref:Protein sorting-associated protein 54 n=1 Tax=Seminavis robusta TaxID=568900 RepID=A0A9N8EEA9_9STRA|nr:protein sorting-associated protein 54 [Seminavis robusta]|eukprot:Sro813_g206240.1 protein sorting-associated protein 54 (1179) ;mRNA; r:41916-45544
MLKSPPPGVNNGESSASAGRRQHQQPLVENGVASQQQQEPEKTPLERQREQALREAEQVLESMGTNQLDHFNLLGVVANPRGSQHGGGNMATTPSSAMSSMHGPNSVSSSTHGGGDGSTFLFSDTYNTLESTLSSVTEQIEALNHVFEDWSRQYLNDYYYQDTADTLPESQLQELPPELLQLELSSLQKYLQKSGVLAQTYQRHAREQVLKKQRQEELKQAIAAAASSEFTTSTSTTQIAADQTQQQQHSNDDPLSDIPEIFFQPDFDLTDPKTFRRLLLNDNNNNTIDGSSSSTSAAAMSPKTASSLTTSLEEPTNDLFQIPPPDHFTGYLDKVEVALLEQVREKSEAFFQETNRFAQLKEWVGELLVDVQRLRMLMEGQAKAIQSWQQVPQWDRTRKHLLKLEAILDGANEILRCKQCIGGLLSAKDDLGAVEQIQYARRLLAGVPEDDDDEGDSSTDNATDAANENNAKTPQHDVDNKETPIELGRLQALRTVGEQLNQYESLVVTSLTEEVVEIFLEWNTSTLASMYGFSTSNNGGMLSSKTSSQHEVERRTLNIVASLQMCHALGHMMQFYGTRLHDMVRMTVRTTVGEFASDAAVSAKGGAAPGTSVSVSVTAMSLERFIDCLDMLFEQLLALLTSASGVDEFCHKEGLTLRDEKTKNGGASATNGAIGNSKKAASSNNGDLNGSTHDTSSSEPETAIHVIVASAAELSAKSIAELLRLRKEVHSLVTLDEMRRIWDTCTKFVEEVEKLSGHKCVALRSMLLTQAKAFVERKHDSNMSSLAAALDSERWTQCEVSAERQTALTMLCSGRAGYTTGRRLVRQSSVEENPALTAKSPEAEVEGIRYKVVWSCLLLVEMIMTNIEAAARFNNLASNVVGKVSELLRLFNSRATQLVLGAGAIHSAARLKSINAKHLSLVTQCLGMIIALLPHIRAALMSQLPPKQHTLLTDLDKIKKEYADHNEKVLNKFVTIIGGIVEHGLAKHIGGIDFDARARDPKLTSEDGVACCVFLEGVITNTRKMHQVLSALLPPEHLQDVFSRIFAFIDQKIPALLIAAAENGNKANHGGKAPQGTPFRFPTTNDGKKRLLDEVDSVTKSLNGLAGVFPWEFSAVSVLAKTLEYELPRKPEPEGTMASEAVYDNEKESEEVAASAENGDDSGDTPVDTAAPAAAADP